MSGWAERRPPATAPAVRPRIVHVIPTLRVAGLEGVVLRLTDGLRADLDHVVMTPSGDGPLRARFPEEVPVIAMAERHRPDRWNALRMAAVFRELRPDIVHSRNWTCLDAIIGARLARVPVVIHGEHGREAADPQGRNPLRRRVRRLLSPLVTQFVTVSRDLGRWLIEDVGVPARKVTVICNGVDTRRFEAHDRRAARGALGIPEGSVAIGSVGRLDPVKDHAGLIQAFGGVSDDPRALLFIAGEGPCRAELEALIEARGLARRVRLLGERHDIPQVLAALDVFVLSSLGEGIANAILEAMATGLPVVATRVGGNPELVVDASTGLLVPPRSPEALSSALRRYLDAPVLATTHGRAGRARAVSEFALDRMVST
ncbi:MAG: glycosyltransferase, partial [Candidatus Rokuibacteriota bacterium]